VGDKLIVSVGEIKRPKDWKVFLSNDDNKVQLVNNTHNNIPKKSSCGGGACGLPWTMKC